MKLLSGFFLSAVAALALQGQPASAKDGTKSQPLYGKGFAKCDEALPTLSVAADSIISTKAEWDAFVKKHPFFVIGAADSACAKCCDSEPLLDQLSKAVNGKAELSYPALNPKKKQVNRKEIKIARVDLANKELVDKLAASQIWFPMGTTIYIGRDQALYKYDGNFVDFNMMAHQMQRLADPVVTLKTQEEVLEFLDQSQPKIWRGDYTGTLLKKGFEIDEERQLEVLAQEMGYNTRVVAFFNEKSEYKEEIRILKLVGMKMANRYNLRIAMVTDKALVQQMRQTHPELFPEVSLNAMVLTRYDGQIERLDLSESAPNLYIWWITAKSTKPVDELTAAAYQLSETAQMPMVVVFVDFQSSPRVAAKSHDLLRLLEDIAPDFERRYKFYWTEEKEQLEQRRLLGVTWDELPAIGINSLDHVVFAYPQGEPFERIPLTRWLQDTSTRKAANDKELTTTDFAKEVKDTSIAEAFLEKTIPLSKDGFLNEMLLEDTDSVVLLYSTENVSYIQRKTCFQYNLVAEALAAYPSLVPDKVKLYSYDTNVHGFPKGISFQRSPAQDLTGGQVFSDEQRKAGLPAIYIFPSGQKFMPYQSFRGTAYAEEILAFIVKYAQSSHRVDAASHAALGKRSVDEQAFMRRIEREGVIQLNTQYDEL